MGERRRRRRVVRWLGWSALVLAILLVVGGSALWLVARESLGGTVGGERLARAERSPQWRDGQFRNVLPRVDGPAGRAMRAFLFGGSDHRSPAAPIAVVPRSAADYVEPPASGLRVTWLGHSTLLLEIDGRRVLIDPVWGVRASPFTFVGPRRFFAPPLPLEELPAIDAVVISHDHYDHLDVPTVRALVARGVRWIVPLGVGAHLVEWGVPDSLATELDWWEAASVEGLTVTATPARHFSGRASATRTAHCGRAGRSPARRTARSTAATPRCTTSSRRSARASGPSISR